MIEENAKLKEPHDAHQVMLETVIRSALESAASAEALGLARNRIILSCKMSVVQDLITVYRSLAERSDYALHLGLTEAGIGSKGIVASTAALGILLVPRFPVFELFGVDISFFGHGLTSR